MVKPRRRGRNYLIKKNGGITARSSKKKMLVGRRYFTVPSPEGHPPGTIKSPEGAQNYVKGAPTVGGGPPEEKEVLNNCHIRARLHE